MSMGHLQALAVHESDEDLKDAVNLVSTQEEMVNDVLETNTSIIETLAQLGANPKKYRRERAGRSTRWYLKSTVRLG